MKAIIVEKTGGPEVLQYLERPVSAPKAGEALVRLEAIGVNFIDVYHRTGLYPLPMPFVPGSEAAGIIEAVGPDVTEVAVGDRVAYAMVPGAYAELAIVPAARLVKVPPTMTAKQAAAAMLQGMTCTLPDHVDLRSQER
jgi:NADPH2:quinone reductase